VKKLVILIDFDNTIVVERYPNVGEPVSGAKDTINWLYDLGHTIIIWSCREGKYQDDAIDYLVEEGIHFHYFNQNCPERIKEYGWDSRKIGCDLMIDDRSIFSKAMGDVVDWEFVRDTLETLLCIYE
jgi:hypothetical protein